MQIRKRLTALLLSAALLIPAVPAAQAAGPDPDVTGSISGTVRIDSPQSLDALKDRDLRVELSQDGDALGWFPLTWDGESFSLGCYDASVSLRNQDGGPLGGGSGGERRMASLAVEKVPERFAGCRAHLQPDGGGGAAKMWGQRGGVHL